MIRAIVRFLYRVLLPRGAKNTMKLYLLLDEQDRTPSAIEGFDAREVLVLAPHMDDEIIGCGGTLRRHVLAGAHVTVVFLTDGRKGNPQLYRGSNLPAQEIATAEEALVQQRKDESARAAQIIGIHETLFLDGPDGALNDTIEIVERLGEIVRRQEPQVIYLPSMLESHPDHWAVNRIFYKAIAEQPLADCLCREYEAWTPLLPNRLVDVTDVYEAKLKALGTFHSQNGHVDYVRTTQGLNSYRSLYRGQGRGYAEAFFESTPAQYMALYERFAGKR